MDEGQDVQLIDREAGTECPPVIPAEIEMLILIVDQHIAGSIEIRAESRLPPVDNFLKPSINLHIVIEGQRMVHRVVTQINFSEVVLIRSIFADIEDRVWNIQPDRD